MRRFRIIIILTMVSLMIVLFGILYRMTIGKMNYWIECDIFSLIHSDTPPIYQEDINGYTYKYYDGITLVYNNTDFCRAEITKNNFKLDKGATIGSKRLFIEFLYKNQTRITDVNDNEYGFVNDDSTYVLFEFDKSNSVKKIIISMGP